MYTLGVESMAGFLKFVDILYTVQQKYRNYRSEVSLNSNTLVYGCKKSVLGARHF